MVFMQRLNTNYQNYLLKIVILCSIIGFFNIANSLETNNNLTATQEQRYQQLLKVLRCPKCENESLYGSTSPISIQLRGLIKQMIIVGKSDTEIKSFLVERYGQYILYQPVIKYSTLILWLTPILLLLSLIAAFYYFNKK